MKCCEKIVKLRIENEYSQEQMAASLDVTTLTIMKWEDGKIYPDSTMKTKISKLFKCEIEYLEDDIEEEETIQNDEIDSMFVEEELPKSSGNTIGITTDIKRILSFINQSYDMICNMELKQRIRCLCEMAVAAVILLVLGIILHKTVYGFMDSVIGYTTIGKRIINIISSIFGIALQIMGVVCWVQFFKVRYCEHFKIEEREKREININMPHIPKFSDFSIVKKLLFITTKIFAVICALPIVALFIGLICLIVMSIYHVQHGMLFLWVAALLVGVNCLAFAIVEAVYKFVTSEVQDFMRTFTIAIIGLVIIGIGTGLSIATYMGYETVDVFAEEEYASTKITISMDDKAVFDVEKLINCEYKVDNAMNKIQVEIQHLSNVKPELKYDTLLGYNEYYIKSEITHVFDTYKLILEDLKGGKTRTYNTVDYTEYYKVIITTSQDNFRILQENQEDLRELKEKKTGNTIAPPSNNKITIDSPITF